jgi:hypothetical protein
VNLPVDYAQSVLDHSPNFRASLWGRDEDDGTDELFVRISCRNWHTGFTREFDSDDMVGELG